jgi:hypothetical protein
VDLELKDLAATLQNIEEARPFEELTVDEVAAAEKSIDEKTAELVSKGRWMVPGYKVRGFLPGFLIYRTNTPYRRSLAILLWSKKLIFTLFRLPFVYSSIVDTRTWGRGVQFLLIVHLLHPFMYLCTRRERKKDSKNKPQGGDRFKMAGDLRMTV